MGRQKLLIIGHTWPEPKATAAGVRMMQLISFFKEAKWNLTFACTSAKSDKSADLEALGIRFEPIQVNDDRFDDFLKELQPDMALFDRYITEEQFGWRVADSLPQCIRILDTEDLHSLRIAREQAIAENRVFELRDWFALDQTKRELASIYRSDLSLVISSYEMKLLEKELGVPSDLLFYLPFWRDLNKESILSSRKYNEREGFIFIGNGKHKPNADAIHYLNTSIWPEIKELLPQAQINIYGAYLPGTIKALHNPKQGFFIRGYVDDAHKAMGKARINLVPLRYGAGLKGKLLLAFENGTPSVSTSSGLEGFTDSEVEHENAFNKPEQFANEAVRLYTSQQAWEQKQEDGYNILSTNFRGDQFKEAFLNTLKYLDGHLEEHRSRNFIGSMLQHHSMHSTKYLSKWITLKNQLKSESQDS